MKISKTNGALRLSEYDREKLLAVKRSKLSWSILKHERRSSYIKQFGTWFIDYCKRYKSLVDKMKGERNGRHETC